MHWDLDKGVESDVEGENLSGHIVAKCSND